MKAKHFELWAVVGGQVLHKKRDCGDHFGFCPVGSVRGWARVERKAVLLFRTDTATPVPIQVMIDYSHRFPGKAVSDRITMTERISQAVALNVERGIAGAQ